MTLIGENETGTVKTRYNYSPFGQTETIGEQSGNPFQYTGRENDGATGLYFYRARYYSPDMGRFISEDPIGLAGGDVNYFAYVRNQPCNLTDPLGLWYIDVNVSLATIGLGATFGVIIDTETGDVRLYAGGGIAGPPGGTFSVTGSSSDPVTGVNIALQGVAGFAGQFGYAFGKNGSLYGELGGGLPVGASFTGFYVFNPLFNLGDIFKEDTKSPVELAICH